MTETRLTRATCVLAAIIGLHLACPLQAQDPWSTTIIVATNPLPIGNCSHVYLDLTDTIARGKPRNLRGSLVTLADFDMTASAPDPTAVVGTWDNPNMWDVCACQAATVGMPVTVTATYPGKMLAANKRVPGVSFQTAITFPVRASSGTNDPPRCAALKTLATSRTGVPLPVSTPIVTVTAPAASPAAPSSPGTPVTVLPTVATATPSGPPAPTSPASSPPPSSITAPGGVAATPVGPVGGGTPAPQTPVSGGPPVSAPAMVNPAWLSGKNLGPGEVELTWAAVPGASYYVVLGPGSSYGGVKVQGATKYLVTGAPAGLQQWLVGSYYLPGPTSTVATAFTKANVQSYGPAQTTSYRVVATGFTVTTAQDDDQLNRDGVGNEIYAAFTMLHFHDGPTVNDYALLDQDQRQTSVYGDISNWPSRVRAGSATNMGGLRDGDNFPSIPTVRAGTVGNQQFPFVVWQGTLTDAADFTVIFPTMWEWNGSTASYDNWLPDLLYKAPLAWQEAKSLMPAVGRTVIINQPLMNIGYSPEYGYVSANPRGVYPDRPIGIKQLSPGKSLLRYDAIVLTRLAVETEILRLGKGAPIVPLTVTFTNDQFPGSYTLYLQVERWP